MKSIFPRINNTTLDIKKNTRVISLINELKVKGILPIEELKYIIENISQNECQELFYIANMVKEKYYKKKVYLRALIEVSNYCKQGCFYCGINRDNKSIKRYRLSSSQIFDSVKNAYNLGYRTFVLQGGDDPLLSDEFIADILIKIKNIYPDTRITLSLGEKSQESYDKLKIAGADRYLLRHETASFKHYMHLHPRDMFYDNRIKCLHYLRGSKYQVGTGMMIGSPFQTSDSLVSDLMFLYKFQPEMIGIGPFIHHHDTPFKDYSDGGLYETLVMVALARIIVPKALIPATTALGSIISGGRELALKAGANVLMPNLGPEDKRELYSIYDNKITISDSDNEFKTKLENKLIKEGHIVDYSVGDHIDLEGVK
ncbi:[FeFe] hydrogenase H-cluster radical SAM maturase HydE [Candidatus Izimaplasma bacterium ZiA1]|uniref:[FeFe] hydrogenase H-cluster radical SAM maturase HydE n=1 Tax=Candidatus Izimoplasma sp. ZiA1 TaxID=2024899 RepID=UPI000BAA548A|nr:[FeFe] hydrogenase H-cluster radical SAM maturase HydE [Candidatus Izimaplasma bacterium ZiA1]